MISPPASPGAWPRQPGGVANPGSTRGQRILPSRPAESYGAMHMHKAIAVMLCVTLAGCSLARRHPDEPRTSIPSGSAVPQPPPDVVTIPDAVPRAEPRSTRGNPPFYEV